jgi:hypothetical protein
MSGSTENQAQGTRRMLGQRESAFNLATARKMVPLVRRIVEDVLQDQRRLIRLRPELNRLDRERHRLSWPERSRRYELQEEMAAADKHLQETLSELAGLKLIWVDAITGRVGFPTIVNSRKAFFSWEPGEESIRFWHFPNDLERKPVPASWARKANLIFSTK